MYADKDSTPSTHGKQNSPPIAAKYNIEIKNGIATIILDCDQLSVFSKAFEMASRHTFHVNRQNDGAVFQAYKMAFKAATIAVAAQMSMQRGDGEQAEQFAQQLLSEA